METETPLLETLRPLTVGYDIVRPGDLMAQGSTDIAQVAMIYACEDGALREDLYGNYTNGILQEKEPFNRELQLAYDENINYINEFGYNFDQRTSHLSNDNYKLRDVYDNVSEAYQLRHVSTPIQYTSYVYSEGSRDSMNTSGISDDKTYDHYSAQYIQNISTDLSSYYSAQCDQEMYDSYNTDNSYPILAPNSDGYVNYATTIKGNDIAILETDWNSSSHVQNTFIACERFCLQAENVAQNSITDASLKKGRNSSLRSTKSKTVNAQPRRRRKRIITPVQRKAANGRERRRIVRLNDAFEILRDNVPISDNEQKKLSRTAILRLAVEYIAFMKDLLGSY